MKAKDEGRLFSSFSQQRKNIPKDAHVILAYIDVRLIEAQQRRRYKEIYSLGSLPLCRISCFLFLLLLRLATFAHFPFFQVASTTTTQLTPAFSRTAQCRYSLSHCSCCLVASAPSCVSTFCSCFSSSFFATTIFLCSAAMLAPLRLHAMRHTWPLLGTTTFSPSSPEVQARHGAKMAAPRRRAITDRTPIKGVRYFARQRGQ